MNFLKTILFRLYSNTAVRFFSGTGLAGRLGVKGLHRVLWRRLAPRNPKPVRFKGGRFAFFPKDPEISQALYSGRHEAFELDVFLSSLRGGMNALDIGANLGIYTVLAALKLGSGKVFSIEAEPNNIALLEKNIGLNGLQNVVIIGKAACDRAGRARLELVEQNSGGHFLAPGVSPGRAVEVETARLDDLISSNIPIHIIKMDVEGSELRVIRGMPRIFADPSLSRVFAEFSPQGLKRAGEDPVQLPETLLRSGFSIYHINERRRSLDPVSADTALSLALKNGLINILAERKSPPRLL